MNSKLFAIVLMVVLLGAVANANRSCPSGRCNLNSQYNDGCNLCVCLDGLLIACTCLCCGPDFVPSNPPPGFCA